jgi:hypothetical protein
MGVLAWILLFGWGALIATVGQYALLRGHRAPSDHDWIFLAGGAVLGGFTAHVWYGGSGPIADGLYMLQALAGGILGAIVVETIYRLVLWPRQAS